MADAHIDQVVEGVKPSGDYCKECLEEGTKAVALRECLTCGHVGCCDSSIGLHATGHYKETGHPIMQAFGEAKAWRWCYIDAAYVD